MLYHLIYEYLFQYLEMDLGIFRLFKYLTVRSVMSFITALIITFVIAPPIIKYLRNKKIGQTIRDDGPQTHLSKSGTPTMGGVIILLMVVLGTLLFANLTNHYVLLMVMVALAFGSIGFIDDYLKLIKKNTKGLSPKLKLIMQFGFATLIMLFMYSRAEVFSISYDDVKLTLEWWKYGDIYVPFFDDPISLQKFELFGIDFRWLYIPFGVILIVGASNAVNLTDGLDGLATGLTLIVCATLVVLAYLSGNAVIAAYLKIPFIKEAGELAIFLAAVVGASMGFLWYNSHPASVFMGDTGALSLGAIIGVLLIVIKKELLILIIGGVFVAEALSVLIQVIYFKWKKKRIFKMAPLHHHYELKGWSESKVITRFWIIGIILALISLATLKIQ